jgi:hypothetical protein
MEIYERLYTLTLTLKVKSTWMEGVSGKEYGAGFCNSERVSSGCI